MNIGALFSGGKDSTFCVMYYQMQGWDVRCLITLKSINPDSYMFHTPNISLAALQAQAMDIPLIEQSTLGEKESELEDLKEALKRAKQSYGIEGICVGALYSDYQQERVNRICEELGLRCFSPLWHKDQTRLVTEMIDAGFVMVIQHVAAFGLDKSWLNVPLTHEHVEKLQLLETKYGVNVAGEGGEYETFVLDAPMFKKKIEITHSRVESDESTARLIVLDARLVKK